MQHICSESAGRSPQPSCRATSRPRGRPRCARAARGSPPARGRSRAASRGLLELVRAELDDERPDDRDRDHDGAGVRLLGAAPGFVVERERLVADDARGSRRAARAIDSGVVLARQSASAELILASVTATLMDGKALAARIRAEVAREVAAFPRPIGLATVLVGDDPASEVYIRLKHKASLEVGIEARDLRLPAETSEDELLDARRRAERRRRDRRHPRPAAAAGRRSTRAGSSARSIR